MNPTFHGRVHGKRIEFDCELGMRDGQEVDVIVLLNNEGKTLGEGILRSAGAAADIVDFDSVFAQIEQYRKSAAFRDVSK